MENKNSGLMFEDLKVMNNCDFKKIKISPMDLLNKIYDNQIKTIDKLQDAKDKLQLDYQNAVEEIYKLRTIIDIALERSKRNKEDLVAIEDVSPGYIQEIIDILKGE